MGFSIEYKFTNKYNANARVLNARVFVPFWATILFGIQVYIFLLYNPQFLNEIWDLKVSGYLG